MFGSQGQISYWAVPIRTIRIVIANAVQRLVRRLVRNPKEQHPAVARIEGPRGEVP